MPDNRFAACADGRSFTARRWNSPLSGYAELAGRRVATAGEGRWPAPGPEGTFSYLELTLDDIRYGGMLTDDRNDSDTESPMMSEVQ